MADGKDEFVTVVSRKNARRSNSKPKLAVADDLDDFEFSDEDIDLDKLALQFKTAKSELTGSKWIHKLFETIDKSAELLGWVNGRDIEDVFCYGLGNASLSKRVKYQLSVLLLLRERYDCAVKVYDPLFFPREIKFLESLGVEVLKENEEGKRKIYRPAVVYFPHCVKELSNNFLYANWGPGLKNCVLFANSFTSVLEQLKAQRMPDDPTEYIGRINPYTQEFGLEDCIDYMHAFHGTVIHVFTPQKLDVVPKEFWEDRKEPVYPKEVAEWIANPNKKDRQPSISCEEFDDLFEQESDELKFEDLEVADL